ncbi:MAG: isoleucine--tRNA ligase [Ignavibacteriae bacterium]|nr:isoleucine--tRNA ligase [Ignavibacteriota bacterium]MCB9243080.1 isoleucine--tRNA ligase [Ignavibacteriales bacterium]
MSRKLPENINLPEIEKEVLDFWEADGVFKKSISEKEGKPAFTFYEGPPTANGIPGIHHVISRAVKDTVCRYKTMSGFQVNRKAGWDTHGLPVEIEVEKKLGIKSKNEIEEFGVIEFNKACRDSVFTYVDKWEELTRRMGYWVDLEHAYVTFHNEYIESVWWALKRLFDAGLIYKGFKIIPFCPICESPLSSHEVAQGYEDLKDPSVYVKFKVTSGEHKDADLLVWTTTPWTLPSNTAVAVNPKQQYVKITTYKPDEGSGSKLNTFILAKERLDSVKEDYTIDAEFSGKDLEGTEYEPLYKFFTFDEKAHYVTLGDFITMEDGTGIVHIAPAFGEDDYQTGLKYKLPVLQAVGKNGRFKENVTPFAGKNFKEADPEIMNELKSRDRLYRKEMFTHSYPHCWRHHVPLMYYATDSWFIKTTDYKDRMVELNKTINWHPPEFGTGRFGNWLEENKDWAVSRNRFWGTPLPIWYWTDDEDTPHYEAVGSIEELKEKAVNWDEVYPGELDLHKPFIDSLILKSKEGKEMKRVESVIDAWFDSGSMPFAQRHYPFENKELFVKTFPADFIAEAIDQTRGWFYSLHAISTFLFDQPAYKNLIVNGHILDKNGKKMSKSMGNIVNPYEMMDKHGADVLRWYMITMSPIGKSKLFNEDELRDVRNKFFDTLINTYKFYVIYSELTGFKYDGSNEVPVSERAEIDKWIISKLNTVKKEYTELMDGYDITRAARLVSDFTLDEVSNWYVRRNRKRFRNPENETDKLSAYQTLYTLIEEILKMVAPFSPMISDKLYMSLTDGDQSIHLTEYTPYDESAINTPLEKEMETAQTIVYLVRSMRVRNNLKTRQPLKQILVPVNSDEEKARLKKVESIILDEVNVKELNLIEGDSDIIVKKAKPNFKVIGPKFGKDVKAVQQVINGLSRDEVSKLETEGQLEKDGFTITPEDVEVFTEDIEGWIVESDKGITVALDTRLDEELIEEGIVREFINRVQNYRKTNDFEVNDRIKLTVKTTDEISKAINNHINYIKSEILCDDVTTGNGEDKEYFKSDINGQDFEFYIEKV